MFDEAEQESDIHPKTLQTTEVKAHKRTKRTRDEIMADLPVEEVFHVYEKYCNAMPLYRLEKDFAAKGANISRITMANWIILASQLLV